LKVEDRSRDCQPQWAERPWNRFLEAAMMEGFTLEDLGVKNVEELVEGLVRLFGSEERFIRAFVRISDKERLLRILDDERALRGLGEEQLVRLLGQERILRTLIQKFGIERVQQIIQQVAQEESQSHQEG
jgi:hypothetical protein